jgi:gliding motility-associated protein GldE
LESSPDGDTLLLPLLLQVTGIPTANITILIIIILVLLLMTAITAGAETAFFSLSAKDINYLKSKENSPSRNILHLLEQPKLLLATIVVVNNFINIAIVITTNQLTELFFDTFYHQSTAWVIKNHAVLYYSLQVVVITFLLVLFGEVLPKVYATQNNLRMAFFSAPAIKVMLNVFRPLSNFLVTSTNFIEGKFSQGNLKNISSKDFEHAIELTVGHSASKEEVNIFKGILKFGNITAKQVMRSRLDVAAIDYDLNFKEIQTYCIEMGYSRLPVYNESLDKIAGIIHTKDFLPYSELPDFDWHKLIRPAYFVHESKLIEDLLKEFQQKRMHFAIVVDEFGGTSGIITLEDIMEEIIGDIKDEFDEDDLSYKKIDDNTFIFDGKTFINDMCRIVNLPNDTFEAIRGESDSIGGLLLEISGKFPQVNEQITYNQFLFTVQELEKFRITKVKLYIDNGLVPAQD